jgi:hypothetical protein
MTPAEAYRNRSGCRFTAERAELAKKGREMSAGNRNLTNS